MKQENQLLRSQLQTRLGDLAATKARVVELEEKLAAARAAEREVEAKLSGVALLLVGWGAGWLGGWRGGGLAGWPGGWLAG